MKKSEAKNLIKELIEVNLDTFPIKECQDATVLSALILEALERKGMMPPIIEEKSFITLDNGQDIYAVHEWESE